MYEKDGDFQYRQLGTAKEGLLTVGPQESCNRAILFVCFMPANFRIFFAHLKRNIISWGNAICMA
jgi:hypothetical protein